MSALLEPDQFDQGTIDLVNEFGWAVTFVHPNADDPEETPNFAYTTNLEEHCGLPELIVFGVPVEPAHQILTEFVEKTKSGFAWSGKPQRVQGILDQVDVELREVHASNFQDHFGVTLSFQQVTGRKYMQKALQIFWPNKDGEMPWDTENGTWIQPRLDLPKAVEEAQQ